MPTKLAPPCCPSSMLPLATRLCLRKTPPARLNSLESLFPSLKVARTFSAPTRITLFTEFDNLHRRRVDMSLTYRANHKAELMSRSQRFETHIFASAVTQLFTQDILNRNRAQTQENRKAAPCLFALTGQSNVTNSKSPLSLLFYASSLGYYTLLDAAALAPTSVVNLTETPVDAMAISFYKMFGFPTGVGALVVKKSFLKQLKRPWFAGGTVDVVQVPGTVVTRSSELHEQFEVGSLSNLPF